MNTSLCSGVPGIGRVQPLTQSLAGEPMAALAGAVGDGDGLAVIVGIDVADGVGAGVAVGARVGLGVGWLVGVGGSVGGNVVIATGSS